MRRKTSQGTSGRRRTSEPQIKAALTRIRKRGPVKGLRIQPEKLNKIKVELRLAGGPPSYGTIGRIASNNSVRVETVLLIFKNPNIKAMNP